MAVSDVNMSSEGSGSSRLRQFGLYKTIDSRTAEFLKLSRKRQIRRGCACAAVSTAITVTVVVSALLVYEYGFHTESKMAPNTLRKFNWFNAVNDTEVTFDKNKDTLVKNMNNNKLLPIILKALDQKRYLETLIEEQSTPTYEKTTEYPLEKNVFTDARNWKSPQLKISEMGYKGPPQGFFKQKHEDSFTKVRKLIDYQRIMTYLNSMSLNTEVEEPYQNHISSTSEPPGLLESYKNEPSLYQFNYQKPESETKKVETKETIIPSAKSYITSKESDKKYCKCPNHSNLADILKKLYNSIQHLRPRLIGKVLNETKICNKQEPENYTAVIVNQLHSDTNQRAPISIRNLNNITIPSKHKKISFFRISNKTITFKPETVTLPAQNPLPNILVDRVNNATDQNIMSLIHNDYYVMPNKDRANRNKDEAIPWKLDFGIKTNEVTTKVYMHTEKTLTTTNTSTQRNKIMKEREIIATDKEAPNNQGFNDDDEHDYADEHDHFVPESNQYINAQPAHIDKEKNKVFEEYNYLANYMDGLSKLYSKTFILNKPQVLPSVETVRPFDLRHFFSYETVDPLVKLEKTSTELPRTLKPIQWLSEKQKMSVNKLPPSQPKGRSVRNRKEGSLKMPRTAMPYFKTKLETATENDTQPHGNVLLPMIQSYLLSKQDSGILNLKFDTTTSVNIATTKGSEEFPFDLKFFSNEENDHIYTNIINNFHTTVTTTTVRPHDKENTHIKKSINIESTPAKRVKNKKRSKKRKLPKVQTWKPPSITYPKTFTNAPAKTESKNHKIKEIFYMTGSETPVDDFEANLHELMYFDRSPVNYTELTNSFLNKTDSGSIENTKSMMPETRSSYLDITRNHGERVFNSHLYSYNERD